MSGATQPPMCCRASCQGFICHSLSVGPSEKKQLVDKLLCFQLNESLNEEFPALISEESAILDPLQSTY